MAHQLYSRLALFGHLRDLPYFGHFTNRIVEETYLILYTDTQAWWREIAWRALRCKMMMEGGQLEILGKEHSFKVEYFHLLTLSCQREIFRVFQNISSRI